jgi:ATP-binding cassette subfamily F protein uup
LIIAKILKEGGNFLILDEPTNDLDLSTLRLLEEALAQYEGCVIVVSHDRYFLNRVCSGIIAFEGQGNVIYEFGDYDYYLEKRRGREKLKTELEDKKAPVKKVSKPEPPKSKPKKLSYKEQRELDSMEDRVMELESKVEGIESKFSDPEFFSKHGDQTQVLQDELTVLKQELENCYSRWEELESKLP